MAYAFKDPNGRTTQVFINLRDNSVTHDVEPFVPFARIVDGMGAPMRCMRSMGRAPAAGSGRGSRIPVFEGGNAFLLREFPRLDYIKRATVVK